MSTPEDEEERLWWAVERLTGFPVQRGYWIEVYRYGSSPHIEHRMDLHDNEQFLCKEYLTRRGHMAKPSIFAATVRVQKLLHGGRQSVTRVRHTEWTLVREEDEERWSKRVG
jgi:hypothetical protein